MIVIELLDLHSQTRYGLNKTILPFSPLTLQVKKMATETILLEVARQDHIRYTHQETHTIIINHKKKNYEKLFINNFNVNHAVLAYLKCKRSDIL